MKILSCRPEPPGSGNVVARCDVELTQDIRVFNLKVSQRPAGGYSVYGPNAMGGRVITFSIELAQEIAAAALAALLEQKPYDRTT